VAFYHRDFGSPLGAWTQVAMRGPSTWTIGERELIAAMVAKWNSCTFCLGAHRAIAAKQLTPSLVDGTIENFQAAPVGDDLSLGDPRSDEKLWRWLYNEIRNAILSGGGISRRTPTQGEH
jgi:alkylhydroperoxidase family enzyme